MNKTLSGFIDESGDFGEYNDKAPYYMVAMVLHNQQVDISSDINNLNLKVQDLGFPPHAIHVGPIIRMESIYERYNDPHNRRSLLNALYHFARKIDIKYLCPYVKKTECSDFFSHSWIFKVLRKVFKLTEKVFKLMEKYSKYL